MPRPPTPRGRRIFAVPALAVLVVLGGIWWMAVRKPKSDPAPLADEVVEPAAATTVPRAASPAILTATTPPAAPRPAPLEYMGDGMPIMPARPDDPHPQTFVHPHPITPTHRRIFRENGLLYQLNEAMDGQEVPRLRALLQEYRDEFPEDPHDMQRGYALIADCLEHPSDEVRAQAQRYFKEEIASTLRRFVLRHCLDGGR